MSRKHRKRPEPAELDPSRPPPVIPDDLRRFLAAGPTFFHGMFKGRSKTCFCCGNLVEPGETYFWTMYHNTPLTPICYHCGTCLGLHSGQIDPTADPLIPPYAATSRRLRA